MAYNGIKSFAAIPDMETILEATSKDVAKNFKNFIRKTLLTDIPQINWDCKSATWSD